MHAVDERPSATQYISIRCSIDPGTADWQLDPRIPPGGRSDPTFEGRKRYSAHNLVLNCCRPYAWKDEFPPVNVNSRELRRQTEEKWKNLFREAGIETV